MVSQIPLDPRWRAVSTYELASGVGDLDNLLLVMTSKEEEGTQQ